MKEHLIELKEEYLRKVKACTDMLEEQSDYNPVREERLLAKRMCYRQVVGDLDLLIAYAGQR